MLKLEGVVGVRLLGANDGNGNKKPTGLANAVDPVDLLLPLLFLVLPVVAILSSSEGQNSI